MLLCEMNAHNDEKKSEHEERSRPEVLWYGTIPYYIFLNDRNVNPKNIESC